MNSVSRMSLSRASSYNGCFSGMEVVHRTRVILDSLDVQKNKVLVSLVWFLKFCLASVESSKLIWNCLCSRHRPLSKRNVPSIRCSRTPAIWQVHRSTQRVSRRQRYCEVFRSWCWDVGVGEELAGKWVYGWWDGTISSFTEMDCENRGETCCSERDWWEVQAIISLWYS